ncbi:hypothetical protein FP828_05075 [bacterium]|nr:hypothetical protein [bacterium]
MSNYALKVNTNWLKRKRDSLIKRMGKAKPFVAGSVVTVNKKCGNKNCKCAKSDYRHKTFYLMYKEKGITKGVYIPVDMVEEVRTWSEEWKAVKELVKEITAIQKAIIKQHVTERRQKKGRK